jgi:hypothetical protein
MNRTPRRAREPPHRCAAPTCPHLTRPPDQRCPAHRTIPEREIRMNEQSAILEAHARLKAALLEPDPEPPAPVHPVAR